MFGLGIEVVRLVLLAGAGALLFAATLALRAARTPAAPVRAAQCLRECAVCQLRAAPRAAPPSHYLTAVDPWGVTQVLAALDGPTLALPTLVLHRPRHARI